MKWAEEHFEREIRRGEKKTQKIRIKRSAFPRVLPPFWREIQSGSSCLRVFLKGNVKVLTSIEQYDGEWWQHVSISTPIRLPTWEELREAKDCFIGLEKKAIQVLPPQSEYVNFHPFVLHLWHNLDRNPLPDFTGGEGTL